MEKTIEGLRLKLKIQNIKRKKEMRETNKKIKQLEEENLLIKNEANNVNGDDDGIVTRCYSQGLITGSRKVVAPLLKDVL